MNTGLSSDLDRKQRANDKVWLTLFTMAFMGIACLDLTFFFSYLFKLRESLEPFSILKGIAIVSTLYLAVSSLVGSLEIWYDRLFQALVARFSKPYLQALLAVALFTVGLVLFPLALLVNVTILPDKFSPISLTVNTVLTLGCLIISKWIFSWIKYRADICRILIPSTVLAGLLFWFAIFSTTTLAGLGYLSRTIHFDFYVLAWGASIVTLIFDLRISTLRNSQQFWTDLSPRSIPTYSSQLWLFASGFLWLSIFYFDQKFYPSLYQEIHSWFKVIVYFMGRAFILSLAVLSDAVRSGITRMGEKWRQGNAFAVSGILLVLTLSWFRPSGQIESLLLAHGGYTAALIKTTRFIFDVDRDGFSTLLGGGDTNDFDAKISPLSREVMNNGIDEDGFGGDLTSERMKAFYQDNKNRFLDSTTSSKPRIQKGNQLHPLVVITADTLPASHLGVYGYHRNTSPHLDRLGKEGIVFRRAYSQSNNTVLSFYSLFRSRYPTHLRYQPVVYRVSEKSLLISPAEINAEQRRKILGTSNIFFQDSNPSLAEVLQRSGYRTIAIPNDRYSNYLSKIIGVRKGFETNFENRVEDKFDRKKRFNDERMTRMAIDYIHEFKDVPFFLWVHYYDHHAFENHPELAQWGSLPVDKYDSGIAKTDDWIGQLLDALRKTGLYEKAIIVFAADHGCTFTPHGETHGTAIDQDQVGIPILIRFPGVGAGKEIWGPVGLIDVMPTLLDYLNLPRPNSMEGWSLLPLLNGQNENFRRYLFLEGWRFDARQRVILDHKAIVDDERIVVFDRLNNFYRNFISDKDSWKPVPRGDQKFRFLNLQKILRGWSEIHERN